jgi:hypothetical protein
MIFTSKIIEYNDGIFNLYLHENTNFIIIDIDTDQKILNQNYKLLIERFDFKKYCLYKTRGGFKIIIILNATTFEKKYEIMNYLTEKLNGDIRMVNYFKKTHASFARISPKFYLLEKKHFDFLTESDLKQILPIVDTIKKLRNNKIIKIAEIDLNSYLQYVEIKKTWITPSINIFYNNKNYCIFKKVEQKDKHHLNMNEQNIINFLEKFCSLEDSSILI